MISYLTHLIDSHWQTWFDQPAPTVNWVLVSNHFDNVHDNVLFFGLRAGDIEPKLVAKVCRHPEYAGTIQDEYRGLQTAWEQMGHEAENRLPRPLTLGLYGKDVVLLTTFCRGKLLAERVRATRETPPVNEWLTLAGEWLGYLHCVTRTLEKPADKTALFAPRAQAFADLYPLSNDEKVVLADLAHQMTANQPQAATVLVQGDFWAGNCLLSGSPMRVVDWQFARWGHDVNVDVYLFVLALARELVESDVARSVAWLEQWWQVEMPAFLHTYRTHAQHDFGLLPPREGLLVTCVELATRPYLTHGQTQADSGWWFEMFRRIVRFET
jgi:aminoglycoside phosphotransferase (APT) family kinase protein